jgi:predicted membrane-bound dolichyl-phosphate-mannose-protein mannosyltransferase
VVLRSRPGVGLDVLVFFVFCAPVVTVLGGGWLCRVVLSYWHLPSGGDVFSCICAATWYTSGLEIISCGVFI